MLAYTYELNFFSIDDLCFPQIIFAQEICPPKQPLYELACDKRKQDQRMMLIRALLPEEINRLGQLGNKQE